MTYFRSLNKGIAFFLLLIFSAVQVVQCLHSHADDTYSSSIVKDTHNTSDKAIHQADTKCKVCDYIQNQQSRHFCQDAPSQLAVLNVKPIIISVDFSESLFERAVHIWTNKGPPQV